MTLMCVINRVIIIIIEAFSGGILLHKTSAICNYRKQDQQRCQPAKFKNGDKAPK